LKFYANNVPIKKVEKKTEEELNLFSVHSEEQVVKLNSIVKIKYLNNNMFVKIKIVAAENNKGKLVNGIQKVSYKSSVAVSLMGKPVGKTVKVGSLDNYVEIIEIINS
jgi:transcription elongation GreA/GreB family factor